MEVWHQVPRSEFRPASLGCERQPFGRKLGPTFRDALLGCVEIPLVDLLRNHTGKLKSMNQFCGREGKE